MIGIIKQNIELSKRLTMSDWKQLRTVIYPNWYKIKQDLGGWNSYDWLVEKNKMLKTFCEYKNKYQFSKVINNKH